MTAPGFVALEGGGSRIEVVPAEGGRVRSLRMGGREWLLQGDRGPLPAGHETPPADAPSAALAGVGWEECAPAAAGGPMPEWVKGCGGRVVPAGGEARRLAPAVALRTGEHGHELTCTWQGERLPWVLVRTLLVRPDGAIEARYEARTTGAHRLPFLWSACLLLPLDDATRLRLPEASRFRVQAVQGAEAAVAMGTAQQWPRLTLGGKPRDLARPWTLPRRSMVRGWLDLASPRTTLQVSQGAARLTIATDGAGVPHCGVALDRGGLRGSRRRGPFTRRAVPGVALLPALGAPDRYAEALGDWQSVTWLVPGEPRRWTMTFRAGG